MLFLFLLCNGPSPNLVTSLSSVMEEISNWSTLTCPWLWLAKMYLKKHKETIIPTGPITFVAEIFVMFALQDMRSHRFAYKTEESHLDLVPLLSKLAFPLSHNAVSNFESSSSHVSKLSHWDYFPSYSSSSVYVFVFFIKWEPINKTISFDQLLCSGGLQRSLNETM